MSDNEMILTLQNEVFAAVNASKMPLAVKSLVLENALMKVNAAMQAEKERQGHRGPGGTGGGRRCR